MHFANLLQNKILAHLSYRIIATDDSTIVVSIYFIVSWGPVSQCIATDATIRAWIRSLMYTPTKKLVIRVVWDWVLALEFWKPPKGGSTCRSH